MALVITNCGKRKRPPLDPTLHARDLAPGQADAVAADWSLRLQAADPATKAENLYIGRAFIEAARTAQTLSAPLAIVSAGLGLVDGPTPVPAYSLTTAPRDPDNILRKTDTPSPQWWASLKAQSPFHGQALETEPGPILAALSSSYLAMVADDWAQWPAERLSRLRLFTKEKPRGVAQALADAWMPYDDRLDALGNGHAGTQGDFAQRAMRHFSQTILDDGDLAAHRAAVLWSLHGLSVREVPPRTRHTDEELKVMISDHWEAVGGRSAAMLRQLRDTLGVACEQGRFQGLFRDVAASRRSI